MKVHGGCEQHATRLRSRLVTQGIAQPFEQCRIPCGAQRCAAWNVQRTDLVSDTWDERTTRAGRTVANEYLGDPDALDSDRGPCAAASGE